MKKREQFVETDTKKKKKELNITSYPNFFQRTTHLLKRFTCDGKTDLLLNLFSKLTTRDV